MCSLFFTLSFHSISLYSSKSQNSNGDLKIKIKNVLNLQNNLQYPRLMRSRSYLHHYTVTISLCNYHLDNRILQKYNLKQKGEILLLTKNQKKKKFLLLYKNFGEKLFLIKLYNYLILKCK